MWKRKLLMQTAVCLLIAAAGTWALEAENSFIRNKMQTLLACISVNYTATDIAEAGADTVNAIIKSPAAVTGRILYSQESQKYGDPLDEPEEGQTAAVYAVAGGQVIESGNDEVLGKYLKIRHEDAESTYGNCRKLYVKAGEHVRKGQVIASFLQEENVDFYYDLNKGVE